MRHFDPKTEADEYMHQCISIDEQQLEAEFCRLPAAVAYWSAQYAEATKDYAQAEQDFKRTEAKSFLTARDIKEEETTTNAKGVEVTKSKTRSAEVLKMMVDADKTVLAMGQEMFEAKARQMQIKGVLDAVISKRDMLQSIGAMRRQEMRGDPLVRSTGWGNDDRNAA